MNSICNCIWILLSLAHSGLHWLTLAHSGSLWLFMASSVTRAHFCSLQFTRALVGSFRITLALSLALSGACWFTRFFFGSLAHGCLCSEAPVYQAKALNKSQYELILIPNRTVLNHSRMNTSNFTSSTCWGDVL